MRTEGGYKTKQRESILSCLRDNPDRHLTADNLVSLLSARGEAVGKTTVYRYLDKLSGEGLVRKYILPDGEGACFQLCGKACHEHFHLKCTSCGALFHTECDFLSGISDHVMEHHEFKIDLSRTVLYGVCRDCGNKKDGETK